MYFIFLILLKLFKFEFFNLYYWTNLFVVIFHRINFMISLIDSLFVLIILYLSILVIDEQISLIVIFIITINVDFNV